MDTFDKVGDILDNFELILVSLLFIVFIFYLFAAGIEKFGIKGFFITLIMLTALIAFSLWIFDITQGQSFLVQALAEFVVCITFYYVIEAFLKGIL
ncbi:hypothetical protein IKE67_09965 [bacterium]|nr:hypothetical protein [bacterium]